MSSPPNGGLRSTPPPRWSQTNSHPIGVRQHSGPVAVRATRAGAFEFPEKPVDRLGELTRRERQIGKLLVEGLSNAQMAERLNISVRTVEMHRLRMMRRLGVNNTAQAVKRLADNLPETHRD